jgi:hypothetical protein
MIYYYFLVGLFVPLFPKNRSSFLQSSYLSSTCQQHGVVVVGVGFPLFFHPPHTLLLPLRIKNKQTSRMSLLPLALLLLRFMASPEVVVAAAFHSAPAAAVTTSRHPPPLHHWRQQQQQQHIGVVPTRRMSLPSLPSSSSSSSSLLQLYSTVTNRPTELPDSLVDAAAMAANVR